MSVRRKALAIGTVLILAAASAGLGLFFYSSAPPIRIAILGPLSGDYAGSGKAMVAAARLHADRINDAGGIRGRPLEIESFDTKADPTRATKLAQRIADSDAVAVVGAYFSSVAMKAAPTFKKRHMPAITASATAPRLVRDNLWYYRVVPDNNSKGRFSALYTQSVLDRKAVDIVYEDDAYGKTLARAYTRKARALGLQVGHLWAVDSSLPNTGQRLDTIVDALRDGSKSDALLVALLGHDSARLIAKLHANQIDRTIIGGDAVGLSSFRDAFKALKVSRRAMAAATEGVYTTTYFLPDIANEQAQQFIGAFRARYQRDPKAVAAPSYDAVGLIGAALRQVDINGEPQRVRDRLRQQLRQYNSLANAYRGVTGRLFFNDDGGVVKPSTFGIYTHGRLISAPVQLTPVVNPNAVTGLGRLKKHGDTATMGDRDYYKTSIVYTGVDINALDDINTRRSTFNADFYLWFRFPEHTDFDPRMTVFNHAAEDIELGPPVASKTLGRERYVAYRIDATLSADFDFHAFPFDAQTLAIRLRPKHIQSDRLKLVPDNIGMRTDSDAANPRATILADSNAWRLRNVRIFADTDTTESTLGDPVLLEVGRQSQISYSRLNILVDVQRLARSYVLSNLAPLFFVLMLGYAMLFVPVEGPPFTARINLGVLALLTTVSFSLKTSRELPDVSYLVLLDYLYFAVYFLLLYGIGSSILKLHWVKQGYSARVYRLEWTSRVLMPLLLVLAVVIGLGVIAR